MKYYRIRKIKDGYPYLSAYDPSDNNKKHRVSDDDKKYVIGFKETDYDDDENWYYLDRNNKFSVTDDNLNSPRLRVFSSLKEARQEENRLADELFEEWKIDQEPETQEDIDDLEWEASNFYNVLELKGNETFYPSGSRKD